MIESPVMAAGKPLPLSKFSAEITNKCATGSLWNPATWAACELYLIFDPPGDVASIGFELSYDPTMFEILPAKSGFLCDFSDGAYCPSPHPNMFTADPNFMVGGPRPGTTYSLTVGPGMVSLTYDLSANPTTDSGDRNFFALALQPMFFIPDFTFHAAAGQGDIQILSTTCQTVDNQSCGSDSPAFGISGVPEPASWAMMIGGFAFAGAALRRRKVSVRFA